MVGEQRKVALCITNYNRVDLLFKSFENIITDPRIGEIIISDDCSDDKFYREVAGEFQAMNVGKMILFKNGKNLGCYHNKAMALSKVDPEYQYAIILDSDNVIDTSYLDALFEVPEQYWDGKTILAPEFARPHFNYAPFAASYLTKDSIKQHIPTMADTRFDCLINCANYVVPVKEYLRVFDPNFNPWTCDTVYQLYNWLKAGNAMYVVPGMQYDHLIHDGSHYKEHNRKVPGLFNEITGKIMAL